ncbi:YlbF family regulator [Anaerosporobacter faecicola]|uniref:YlbF family regulator n=1 Tax=Anaerosporobacter faecicola TaxID=2718714 RepID=UPI0014391EA1|nr:YlbF family regulator [Anaerosporobacter faecicola]
MKDIEYQMKNLVAAIKKSNEYNQYQRLYASIEENEALLARLNEYRSRNYQVQLTDGEHSLEICRSIREEYKDVLMNPLVQEFLIVEQRVNTMLKTVNHYLWDNIDLKIDFII